MIVIVCGIPASGKTTLATRLQRRLADRGHEFDLRHSDDYDRHTYDRMYEDVADIDATSNADVDGTPAVDRDWILDGTFYEREYRNRFYRLDDVYVVWAKASLETCLERNRNRDETIPESGLRAIAGQFESPRADLEIDTEELDAEAALDRLDGAVLDWIDG